MTDFASLLPSATLAALIHTAAGAPNGAFVEVGVYRGGSALRLHEIAARQGRVLHLFDTFSGMPFADDRDRHRIGDFADGIDLPQLRELMPKAVFHVGVFPATLPPDLDSIAFAHVDCDQYRSVFDCIGRLWPFLVPKGIMWFDDFRDVPAARQAVLDLLPERLLREAPEGRRFAVKPSP